MVNFLQIGGGALCGLGAAGLIETFFDLHRWQAAPGWPIAEGRVVRCRLHQHGAAQDDYTERLKLAYEFTVDGVTYTGHRIRAGQELDLTIGTGPTSAWSTGRSDAAHYSPGLTVRVHYDPRNPKRCCLKTGGLPGILLKLTFCLGLLIAGAEMIRRSLS